MNVASPSVWRSPFLFSPCLDGLRRPAILLPDDVGENLRETFVHELAHLARRDGLWNLLRRSTTAGLWLQPLVWLLSRRLEVAAEEVCDDYVVHFGAERTRYAGHLLELAGRALPPVAPGERGHDLASLDARAADRSHPRHVASALDAGRRTGRLAMLAVGLAVTALARACSASTASATAEAGTTPRPSKQSLPTDKTIRGQVVGPDGKPVAGATVIAWRVRPGPNRIDDDHARRTVVGLERTTPGADGRYEFNFETPELAAEARLIATAPGFRPGLSAEGQSDPSHGRRPADRGPAGRSRRPAGRRREGQPRSGHASPGRSRSAAAAHRKRRASR